MEKYPVLHHVPLQYDGIEYGKPIGVDNGVSMLSDDEYYPDADENASADTNPGLTKSVYSYVYCVNDASMLSVGQQLTLTLVIVNHALETIRNIRLVTAEGNCTDLMTYASIDSLEHGDVLYYTFTTSPITDREYASGVSEGCAKFVYTSNSGSGSVIQETTVMITSGRTGVKAVPTIMTYNAPGYNDKLYYHASNRDLSICFKLKAGNSLLGSRNAYLDSYHVDYALSSDDVISYSFENKLDSSGGISFGSANSGTFSMVIDKRVVYRFDEMSKRYDRTALYAYIGIRDNPNSEYIWTPFGAWFVDQIDSSEQDLTATITGSDALNAYELGWVSQVDSINYRNKVSYGEYLQKIINTYSNYLPVWDGVEFVGYGEKILVKTPEYENGFTSVRALLSYVAEVAGGHVFIDKNGEFGIHSLGQPNMSYGGNTDAYNVDSNMYTTLVLTPSRFTLDGIWYANDTGGYVTRQHLAGDDTVDRWASYITLRNRIFITNKNPLVNSSRAGIQANMLNIYYRMRTYYKNLSSGSLEWIGDPCIRLGDILTITDTEGKIIRMMVQTNSYTYDSGGLRETISCDFGGDYDSRSKYVTNIINLHD